MSNARNIANLPNGDDAPVFACRAWVNFNGTTNTAGFCTIRGSGNVSTVADNGIGDYTVNFATAMPDVNYAATHMVAQDNADSAGSGNVDWMIFYSQTTSALRVTSGNSNTTSADEFYVAIAIFR